MSLIKLMKHNVNKNPTRFPRQPTACLPDINRRINEGRCCGAVDDGHYEPRVEERLLNVISLVNSFGYEDPPAGWHHSAFIGRAFLHCVLKVWGRRPNVAASLQTAGAVMSNVVSSPRMEGTAALKKGSRQQDSPLLFGQQGATEAAAQRLNFKEPKLLLVIMVTRIFFSFFLGGGV